MLQMFKRMIEVCHPVLAGKARQVHASPGVGAYIAD